jgi:ribulose-phosphate 3-epimerase
MIQISPSILSADFLNLGQEIATLEKAGADLVHIDVMDGHYVPNLTVGPPIVSAIKKRASVPLDVHMMIEKPDKSLDAYIDAGANILTVHVESVIHLERTVQKIKSHKVKAGVALNPSTHEHALKYVIGELDLVLVMSVNPGFGGQNFIPSVLDKIAAIKAMLNDAHNTSCMISVDGGINDRTGPLCISKGATCLVAGSYIFAAKDYRAAMAALRPR